MIVLAFLKRRRGPRRLPSILGSRPGVRRKLLVYLVPIALTGCRTFSSPGDHQSNGHAAPRTASAEAARENTNTNLTMDTKDPSQNRTEFHSKITKEEQYNAHLELGRFQEGQEDFELALEEYQKALEACESQPPFAGGRKGHAHQAMAHRRIGTALDRLGRFEQAEVHYRTALKLNPNDPKVWNDAGYSYYLQSRWADAERALKTADSLDPNNTRILTNLGLTLAASGKTDEALAAFTKAGGNAVGNANLAYVLAAMGKNDLALKHYKTALEYQPELDHAKQAMVNIEAKAVQMAQLAATSPPVAPITTPIAAASLPVPRVPSPVVATSLPVAPSTTPVVVPSPPVARVATPVGATSPPLGRVATPVAATNSPGSPLLSPAAVPISTVTRAAKPVATMSPPVPGTSTPVAAPGPVSSRTTPVPATSPTRTTTPPGSSLASRPAARSRGRKPPPPVGRPKPADSSNSTVQASGVGAKGPIDTSINRTSGATRLTVPPATLPTSGN